MTKIISEEEVSARLNFAEELHDKFPYIKGYYKILSSMSVDGDGNEIASFGIELLSSQFAKDDRKVGLQLVLNKYLVSVINEDVLKLNKKLTKEVKELKKKLNENKV